MPQDPFDDIVRGYDQQFAPPKVKPVKPAKPPSFDDLVKDVDGQTGSVPTRREQRRQNITALQDELTATTPQVKPGNTLNVTTGRQYPTPPPPPFQSPIDMRLNAPNEAQKAFDRAAAAVQPAAQPKPRNAFQAPRPKPMLERVMAQQAVERQQPQTVETDPQRLEQLKQATGRQLAEQRDVRMQQSRANVEQMNPLQRMAVRGLAKAGGATNEDIRAIAPPQGLEADLMRATNAGVRQVGSIVRGAGQALPGFLPPAVGRLRKPIYQGTVGAAKNIQGGLNTVADAVAPDDPADQSFRAKLGRGVGSVGASMGGALATGGGSLAAGTLGALGNLGQVAEEREQAGVPVSALREAGSDALAIATGMTEALGAGRLLNRLGMKTPVIQRVAQALEEGGQEYAQGYLNDINAKLVAAYDPNRAIDDPLSRKRLEEALIGTILGSAGEVADVSAQRAMAAQQNAQQRATRSAIDQRSAANAAAIAPQPAAAQPVTEPLTEPMAAQPQPSAPATPQAQPQGFPRLPEPEGFNARRAKLLGMPTPAEVNINEQVQAAAQLLDSPNEGDQRQGRRMLNKALTDLRKAEGYLAEAALPPDAPRPFTAVRDAIEARLKPKRAENETAIEPFNRIANQPLNQKRTKNELVTTASNALRAEADAAKIKAAEFEQVGDFTQAAATYQAAHQNLKRLRRSMGMPKTPEAVAQINQIDREISIADANRRKAMQAARTAQRQANAQTAPLSKELSESQKPNAQVSLNQPVDSAPLLRPEAVQNPEPVAPVEERTGDTIDFTSKTPARKRGGMDTENLTIGGMLKRRFPEGVRLADKGEARNLGGREGNALVGLVNKNSRVGVDDVAYALHEEGLRLPDGRPFVENSRVVATEAEVLDFLRSNSKQKVGGTKSLERRLAEEEAAYNERQPFDQIVADVDAEPTNRLRNAEYEGGEVQRYSKPLEGQAVEREAFQPDTADLREVREFSKREPRTEQFTEEPPTAPLARRRQPIRPPAPASPRQVGNRPLSVDVAGTRTPTAMSPDFPRARREMVKQGREVEARLTEGQDKGEFGNVAEAMFKSNTPDVLHGQDSFFHDPDLKGKLGLTRDAEMADVRRELKTQLACSLGLTADEVSLSHIKPEVWRAWAKQKGLGREAVRKLEAGIARAERKQRATETNAQIVAEESQRAQSEVRQPAAEAGKSIDAQIKDIRDLQAFDLIDDKEAKRKIAALEAQRPKAREQKAAQSASRAITDARIQFKSGKRGQPGTVYANEPALDVLRAAYEEVFGRRVEISNVNFNSAASRRMAQVLMKAADDPDFAPEVQEKLQEISREFNFAWRDGKTVSVVSIAEGRKFSDIKTSRRHELFHDAQEGLGNSPGFLAKHKYGKQLIEGLAHYSFEDRTTEAAAFLAGGQAKDFGLTDEQGKEFLADYFDDIVAVNGADALRRFVSMAPQVQDALKEARQKYDVQGKTGSNQRGARTEAASGRTGTASEAARSGASVSRNAREQKRLSFSFGRIPEGRGQVLASGFSVQGLFGRAPKDAKAGKPVPLPRNFNLADWSQKLYRDAMAAGLPKDARAKYDAAKTVREKNIILMESKLDSAREAKIFDLIDRAQVAAEKNDGSALYDVLSDATDLMRKTPSERGLKRVGQELGNAVSLPRAIMASMDVSAPLRQGAILTLPPTQWGSAAKATLRMFQSFSTAKYKEIGKQINLHEDAETARESGLYLSTDKSGLLTKKEEDFISGWADKIPLVKHSEQAYKTYLDSLRMDSFARYKKSIDKTKGLSEEQKQRAYQAAAEWINTATGRGSLGSHFESAMPTLSKVLFAPRYAASRIQVLNPYTYAKNARTPEGRAVLKNQMSDLVQYAGMVSLTLALASAAGATVGLDPEDPDFLKIKVGQTRYDVLAGLQQPMRLFYRLGAAVSDRLKGEKPERNQSVGDISKKFVRSKLAPVPSFLWDYFEAKDFIGRDFEMKRAVLDRVVPLMWKDMADAYEKEGGAGAAKILPAAFGIGVQNYGERTGATKESRFTKEAEGRGLKYDFVRPKVGEPEAVYKQRVQRVESWMSEYGDKLLSHPSYSLLTESQKQAAIESLRRRIGTQQNATRPRLDSLAPEKVIQSVLKSEATRPKREAGKLWSPPARP